MRFRLLLSILLPITISAQPSVQKSEIKAVTVYRSGAVVEREVPYSGPAGKHTFRIDDLPGGLSSSAIQVHVPDGWRLLKTDYRTLTQDERELPELAGLSAALKKATDAIEAEKDILTSLHEDLRFLANNSDVGEGVSTQQLRTTDEYLAQRRRAVRTAIRQSKTNIETLQKEASAAQARLIQAQQTTLQQESALFIEVDIRRNARNNFTIEYFTSAAEWTPFYNIRSNGPGEPLELEHMATIKQSSGEDWNGVDLTLSTGNPAIGASEPDLPTWYLGFSPDYVPVIVPRRPGGGVTSSATYSGIIVDAENGETIPMGSVEISSYSHNQSAITDVNGRFSLNNVPQGRYNIKVRVFGYEEYSSTAYISHAVPPIRIAMQPAGITLDEVVVITDGIMSHEPAVERDKIVTLASRDIATIQSTTAGVFSLTDGADYNNFSRTEQRTSTEYHIDEPYTVPSTGAAQEAWIQTTRVAAEYVYRVRPARAEEAFLIAHIADWEDLGLINATAHLFLEGTYNGESLLDPATAGDTLSISMGMDPGITIKRTRVNPRQSKRFLSSTIREDFTYEIEVRNTKSAPVRVHIQDQYPVSRHSDISVERKDHGDGSVNNETGIITWERTIEPGSSAVIRFSFEVKFPKDRSVNLPK